MRRFPKLKIGEDWCFNKTAGIKFISPVKTKDYEGKVKKEVTEIGEVQFCILIIILRYGIRKKKFHTRREFLNLHLHANPVTSLEKKENLLYPGDCGKDFI
jgi:hypothetical protein